MEEEEQTRLMHQHRLGKRERHTHKTGEALPLGVIPTLHMGSFSRLFSHGSMLLLWDDRSRDLQKVGEALALPILLWNGFPQPLARPFVPITHGIGDHLPCLTAKGNPNPGAKRFLSTNEPSAHPILGEWTWDPQGPG
jgi:hypothetical protein